MIRLRNWKAPKPCIRVAIARARITGVLSARTRIWSKNSAHSAKRIICLVELVSIFGTSQLMKYFTELFLVDPRTKQTEDKIKAGTYVPPSMRNPGSAARAGATVMDRRGTFLWSCCRSNCLEKDLHPQFIAITSCSIVSPVCPRPMTWTFQMISPSESPICQRTRRIKIWKIYFLWLEKCFGSIWRRISRRNGARYGVSASDFECILHEYALCFQGFAFVTYGNSDDAEKAIRTITGHRYDHLILKVEWAK